jgi:hypothetical protein
VRRLLRSKPRWLSGSCLHWGTARADKLTQAILAKAFRGELVPTEAELARREGRDYEPVGVLLERVKREREGAAYGPSRRRSKANRR